MRLLFDQNLSFKLCARLSDRYPGSEHVRLIGLGKASDRSVWELARDRGYVLVTFDSDFAEIAALRGAPPKVIWLRGGNQPTAAIEGTLRREADTISAFVVDHHTACLEVY